MADKVDTSLKNNENSIKCAICPKNWTRNGWVAGSRTLVVAMVVETMPLLSGTMLYI